MFWNWLRTQGLLKPATRFEVYSLICYAMYVVLIVVGLFLIFGKSIYLGELYGAGKAENIAAKNGKKTFQLFGNDPARNGFCFKRKAVVSGSSSVSEHEGICSADVTFFSDKKFKGLAYGSYLVCSITPKKWRYIKINESDRRIIELGGQGGQPKDGYRPYVRVVEGGRYGVVTRDGEYFVLKVKKYLPLKMGLMGKTVQNGSIIIEVEENFSF